jgi:hypothetical protein
LALRAWYACQLLCYDCNCSLSGERLRRTRWKHELRFAASCRARSRRRSYSASASALWSWLKAGFAHCLLAYTVSSWAGLFRRAVDQTPRVAVRVTYPDGPYRTFRETL